MSVSNDDVRVLDIIAKGELPSEQLESAMFKLGADEDDIRAWKLSKSPNLSADQRESVQIKVIDKIRTQKQDKLSDEWAATVKGGLQGVTFGFADEIESGFRAGLETIKTGADFQKIYDKKVKRERAELKRLEEKHPLQFIGAELGASLVLPVPGARVRGAKVAGKMLQKFGYLALESAVQSAGKSEADIMSKQFIEDVAKGTTLGTVIGGLGGKAVSKTGAFLKKGISPAKRAANVVSSVLFDLPPAYTEKLIDPKTANKILNPKSTDDIIDSVVELTKDMGSHAKALSMKAQKKLSDEYNIDVTEVIENIGNLESVKKVQRSTLNEAMKTKKDGAKVIEDLAARSNQDGLISEKELKRFVQDIDLEIPWNKLEWKTKDKVFADIRAFIDHNLLKANKEYAKEMIPVAKIMSNLKDVSKSFSLKREGYKLVPTDATTTKVNNFFNVAGIPKKPVTISKLKELQELRPGDGKPNILEDIEFSAIARRTEGGLPAGSKHILQGLTAGTLFGSPVFGAIAGAVKDRYGRKVGKNLLPALSGAINVTDETLQKAFQQLNPEILERFARTTGRFTGVSQGIDASQKPPSSLFYKQQTSLIPQR